MSNRNPNPTLNADHYVMVFDSLEGAMSGDRDAGLVTVQSFGSGDFSGLEAMDTVRWNDGDVVGDADGNPVAFYLRVAKTKPKTRSPVRRSYGAAGQESDEPSSEDKPL